MTRRPKPRPNESGGYEPNRANAKAGLNRSILDAGWGMLLATVTYKASSASREVVAVDPRNTSRTCHVCGYCEKANRKTQSDFKCLQCGYSANADLNAARNIRAKGVVKLPMVGRALALAYKPPALAGGT